MASRMILLLTLGTLLARAIDAQTSSAAARDVARLADDALEGRLTGSPGADSAAAYIASRFRELGLTQVPALAGWTQTFIVSPNAPAAHGSGLGGASGHNVVALLGGQDPALAERYVVIGAHYDHLGLGGGGNSLDPANAGQVHNGADDNASGVAALLETARRLVERPAPWTTVFVAFSGEEQGVIGSTEFVRSAVIPMDQVLFMLNFDMVGRLRDDRLTVFGAESAEEWNEVLDAANRGHGLALNPQPGAYGPSDHTSFTVAGVPVLHFFTGSHEDYHRSTDDAQKVNVAGLQRVAALATDVLHSVAARRAPLTLVRVPAPAPAQGRGYGAWLGTVPDMTDNPGGVRISGVSPGSPAEAAGLKGGDVVLRIGDHEVPDLQAMTDALRSHKPGDAVIVVVRRDGEELHIPVTLGQRNRP